MAKLMLHRLFRCLPTAAFMLLVAVPAAARADALHWSGRAVVDNTPPFANPHLLNAVSCPSAGLCVAVDTSGNLVASSHPAGTGPTGCTVCSWASAEIDAGHSLTAVSCPTSGLCVVVDDAGDVLTSTNPTGGASAWKRVNVDGTSALTGVSCASAALCVAVDSDGNVVSSANPTGVASDWTAVSADGTSGFTGVACPTTGLCVAVDFSGNVVTSTNPRGGPSNWAAPVSIASGNGLGAIACPSVALCVAGDDAGDVLTSTDPTGGSTHWNAASVDSPSFIRAISCPTTALCVAVDADGNDITSTDPAGGAAAWSAPQNIDGANDLPVSGVSCPNDSLCFALTDFSDLSWSANPIATPTDTPVWQGPYNIAGQHAITGVSCPSLGLCVAASDSGNEVTSVGGAAAPAALASAWGGPTGGAGGQLRAMSCSPTGRLCVGAGDTVIGSGDPGSGPGAHWFHFGRDSRWGQLQGVSCPTDHYCQAVDDRGQVMSLVDQSATGSPAPALSDGPPTQVDGSNVIHAVSCPSLGLCVAVDDVGNALISTNPGQAVWGATPIDPGRALLGVSCLTTLLCFAVDDDGGVVTLRNPGTNPSASVATFDNGHALNAISCTTTLCVAVDDAGQALTSTNASAPLPAWSLAPIDPGHNIVSISCAAAGLCVAGDDDGAAIAGAVSAPGATVSAPHFTSSTSADLSGTVAPNAATVSDCHFNFGTTTAYGHSVPCATAPSGTAPAAVSAHVTGLAPNARLHVQLVAGNAGGTTSSADNQSTTPPLPPTVGPRDATNVEPTSAQIAAWVNPNGAALTGCRFVYGSTTSYGGSVPCQQKVSASVLAVHVTAIVSGLKPATSYHFTLIADNPGGESKGPDSSFRTSSAPIPRVLAGGTVKHGTTSLTLKCPGVKGAICAGRMTLTLRSHNRPITVASARYRLIAPRTTRLRVHLSALALRRLAAAPGHRLRAVIVFVPASGRATHLSIQLRG